MRYITFLLSCLAFTLIYGLVAQTAFAQVPVQGYYKNNGTYVQPYQRSAPNSTPYDNYSTKGNVNPYTNQPGTITPQTYTAPSPGSYQSGTYNGNTTYTGPRGGTYYINSNGNKTYVPR
jgi:hypothetical protein